VTGDVACVSVFMDPKFLLPVSAADLTQGNASADRCCACGDCRRGEGASRGFGICGGRPVNDNLALPGVKLALEDVEPKERRAFRFGDETSGVWKVEGRGGVAVWDSKSHTF